MSTLKPIRAAGLLVTAIAAPAQAADPAKGKLLYENTNGAPLSCATVVACHGPGPTVDLFGGEKFVNRDPTSAVLPPLGVGLMAVFIAIAVYAMASTVSHALTSHMAQIAKSLIVAPLIEELFFRGVVQSRLRAHGGFWGRPWVAIGVTAACFGVAHLATTSMAHAAMVVAPAVVIGWAYERTRSIGLCVALHGAANTVWIFYWSV